MIKTQYKMIEKFIEEKIAPGINSHGGTLEILSFKDNILQLALSGACETCSIQAFTAESISDYILDEFPDLDDVIVQEQNLEEDSYFSSYAENNEGTNMQKTLSIIKPDGVRRNLIGLILARIEAEDLKIMELKMLHMTPEQAQAFYAVHKERPFYEELWKSMSAGSVVVAVLAGDNAVVRYRELMGATDPGKAMTGTLRAEFGLSVGENTVHGSDSLENAEKEVHFFFP